MLLDVAASVGGRHVTFLYFLFSVAAADIGVDAGQPHFQPVARLYGAGNDGGGKRFAVFVAGRQLHYLAGVATNG
jgi:hypothetical protein